MKMNIPNPDHTNLYVNLIFAIIITIIMVLSVAYASFSAPSRIENIMAKVRPQQDARITGVVVSGTENNGISNSEDYNTNKIYGTISLPNANSTVTYKVSATVFLSSEMKIKSITGLDSHLEYELTNYTLEDPLCNTNDECNLGATDEFYITIKYKENSYDSSNTIYPFELDFVFEQVDYVAKIGNTRYETIQAAVDAASSTETRVQLLKNTSEIVTIPVGKNIILDLQGNVLSNDGTNPVIWNYGTTKLVSGTITSSTSQGAINNQIGGHLIVSGGNIIATGTRQAIYNDGGRTEITGSAYLSATTNQRATVQNLNSGTLIITGGTIISSNYSAVINAASMTIGTKDGTVHKNTPVLQGKNYGVESTTNFNFYDGILKGRTAAIKDESKVVDMETGYEIFHQTERIDTNTYQTATPGILVTVTFNPMGGTVTPAFKEVEAGSTIGEMPIPTQTDYEFDGWFTAREGGTEIQESQIITADVEYFAHWTNLSEIVIARIGTTNYATLQEAIAAVPKNNTETTITLLRNTSEVLTIVARQNIVLDIQNYRISNKGVAPVIANRGTLKITNGTITSNTTQGAINNESGGHLTISGGSVIATGTRQAIYNNGGTLTITGTAYLSAVTAERGTVQNLNSGTITITGGTIISTNYSAVVNTTTLTIGTKDGTVTTTTPVIQGKLHGVDNTGTFNFYDGILKGGTSAINGSVADLETNHRIMNSTEIIENQTYQTAYLN